MNPNSEPPGRRKQWDTQNALHLLMIAGSGLGAAFMLFVKTQDCFRDGIEPGELIPAFVVLAIPLGFIALLFLEKRERRRHAIDVERAHQKQSEWERAQQKLADDNYAQAEKELSLSRSTDFSGPVLEVIATWGQYIGKLVQFKDGRMVIGRLPTCELFLENGAVSRQHAAITEVQGKYRIADLGSGGGTDVNGTLCMESTDLKDGDIIRVADVVMQFHESYLQESKLSLFREMLVEGFGKTINLADNQWQTFRELWQMRNTLIKSAHRNSTDLTLRLKEFDQQVFDLLTDEQKILWTQRQEELKRQK